MYRNEVLLAGKVLGDVSRPSERAPWKLTMTQGGAARKIARSVIREWDRLSDISPASFFCAENRRLLWRISLLQSQTWKITEPIKRPLAIERPIVLNTWLRVGVDFKLLQFWILRPVRFLAKNRVAYEVGPVGLCGSPFPCKCGQYFDPQL